MYVVNDISNLTAENFLKSGIQTDAKETRDNAMNGNVIKKYERSSCKSNSLQC